MGWDGMVWSKRHSYSNSVPTSLPACLPACPEVNRKNANSTALNLGTTAVHYRHLAIAAGTATDEAGTLTNFPVHRYNIPTRYLVPT
jgi:hypothetical protein